MKSEKTKIYFKWFILIWPSHVKNDHVMKGTVILPLLRKNLTNQKIMAMSWDQPIRDWRPQSPFQPKIFLLKLEVCLLLNESELCTSFDIHSFLQLFTGYLRLHWKRFTTSISKLQGLKHSLFCLRAQIRFRKPCIPYSHKIRQNLEAREPLALNVIHYHWHLRELQHKEYVATNATNNISGLLASF